jgi:hypothetical protein
MKHLITQKYFAVTLPFTGSIATSATYNSDNNQYYMDYSSNLYNDNKGNLTFDEYKARINPKCELVDYDQLGILLAEYENSLITIPEIITYDDYMEMLDILPPCRWHSIGKIEVFHISERLTGQLVSWYARSQDNYYTFIDYSYLSDSELNAKLSFL